MSGTDIADTSDFTPCAMGVGGEGKASCTGESATAYAYRDSHYSTALTAMYLRVP